MESWWYLAIIHFYLCAIALLGLYTLSTIVHCIIIENLKQEYHLPFWMYCLLDQNKDVYILLPFHNTTTYTTKILTWIKIPWKIMHLEYCPKMLHSEKIDEAIDRHTYFFWFMSKYFGCLHKNKMILIEWCLFTIPQPNFLLPICSCMLFFYCAGTEGLEIFPNSS